MSNENSAPKWKWLVGPAITLVIVFAGFIASWATVQATVATVQEDVAKIEKKTDQLEDKVHDLEVKGAVDESLLKRIQEDINEIKRDIKKMLEGDDE